MKKYDFTYVLKKIMDSDFSAQPFKHIYIENLFSEIHFKEIINSTEITCPKAINDKELIDGLIDKGFNPIDFPGSVTDIKKYIDWHENGKKSDIHSACEGFGMVLRLYNFQSEILRELNEFLKSPSFNKVIAQKFGINFEECIIDGGIQKYLDGYEISPHPDIRKKAATFMVNINPSSESENMNHHTQYLKFKESYTYVKEFWAGNKHIDRAWVPWSWTKSEKQQTKNNSIVLFSPDNDTIHGVKSDYNHLLTQRTQLYGNLWHKTNSTTSNLEWEDLDLCSPNKLVKKQDKNVIKQKLKMMLSSSLKSKIKNFIKTSEASNVGKRNV
jgi:hypothetical protein